MSPPLPCGMADGAVAFIGALGFEEPLWADMDVPAFALVEWPPAPQPATASASAAAPATRHALSRRLAELLLELVRIAITGCRRRRWGRRDCRRRDRRRCAAGCRACDGEGGDV